MTEYHIPRIRFRALCSDAGASWNNLSRSDVCKECLKIYNNMTVHIIAPSQLFLDSSLVKLNCGLKLIDVEYAYSIDMYKRSISDYKIGCNKPIKWCAKCLKTPEIGMWLLSIQK